MTLTVIGWPEAKERLEATARAIPRELFDGVRRASLVMERAVKLQITEQFGGGNQWRASWTSAASITGDGTNVVGVVGSAHPASRIQELGGTIRPVKAGALAVPLTPEAKRHRPRELDLFIVQGAGRRPGGAAFLVRQRGKGRTRKLEYLYMLLQSVTLPATRYLTKAQERAEGEVVALVGGRVSVAIQSGGK